ncbi:uncharacterized protein METZ01_LOCUS113661, partial [marine metagenome]
MIIALDGVGEAAAFHHLITINQSTHPRPKSGAGHRVIASMNKSCSDILILQAATQAIAAERDIQGAGIGIEIFML